MRALKEKLNTSDIFQRLKFSKLSLNADSPALHTGIAELDQIFSNEIRPGKLIEWGLPPGKNSRIFPILFLKKDAPSTVWIYPEAALDIYPPAWVSHGVDLSRIFFLKCDEPVKKLKPLFLDDTFKIIVIDAPKRLSKGDLSFISIQARANKQIIFLIRNYLLNPQMGNPQAHMRINCMQNYEGVFCLNFIKGKNVKKITLTLAQVFHD